jgi:hypothetical protein
MSKIWEGDYGTLADYARSLAGKERLLPAMESGQSFRSARPITLFLSDMDPAGDNARRPGLPSLC